jgi:hypothetical protein
MAKAPPLPDLPGVAADPEKTLSLREDLVAVAAPSPRGVLEIVERVTGAIGSQGQGVPGPDAGASAVVEQLINDPPLDLPALIEPAVQQVELVENVVEVMTPVEVPAVALDLVRDIADLAPPTSETPTPDTVSTDLVPASVVDQVKDAEIVPLPELPVALRQ